MSNNINTLLTITEASNMFNVTRQAIMIVIKSKRLNAKKEKSKWVISPEDWKSYLDTKYDRRFSVKDGEFLFDESLGKMSPKMLAQKFGVNIQHIYYLIRGKKIPACKKGGSYVISNEDIKNIEEVIKHSHKKTGPKVKNGLGNKSDYQRRRKNTYKKISRI